MKEKLSRLMIGRYGVDALNKCLLTITLICLILFTFTRNAIFNTLVIVCIVICYFRMLSKNIQKRYAENNAYLNFVNKIKFKFSKANINQTKEYHIYKCPKCKQKIRIPRGKGKISITCPKCKTEFIKRS